MTDDEITAAAQSGFDEGRNARDEGNDAEDQVYRAVIAALAHVRASAPPESP